MYNILSNFYSDCGSEWNDCVAESEKYIREKSNFYNSCTPITNITDVPTELLRISNDTCFENRKCQNDVGADSEEAFVGGDPSCVCGDNSSDKSESLTSLRYKRQTGEVFRTSTNSSKILRSHLGGKRLSKDYQQLTRKKGSYSEIRRFFIDYSNTFDEDEFESI